MSELRLRTNRQPKKAATRGLLVYGPLIHAQETPYSLHLAQNSPKVLQVIYRCRMTPLGQTETAKISRHGEKRKTSIRLLVGLHRINGRGLILLPTKTKRSRRAVSFSAEVADLFRQVRGTQLVRQVELGAGWNDTGYVFTDVFGNPLDPGRVSKEFTRIGRTAGLPGVRLHDLRHTHASLLLAANVHPKIVSERLGHASVIITLDTYSHVILGLQEDAADKFSQIVADDR